MRRHAPIAAAFLAAVLATCVELDPEPECEGDCGGGGAATLESLCAGRGCEKVVDPATGVEVVCEAALYCPHEEGAAPACCAGRECATDSCADRGCREENSCGTSCLHACADWRQVVLPAEGGPLPRFGPALALDPGSPPERPPLLLAVGGRVDDAGVQSVSGESWALSFTETPHWELLEATDPPVQNPTLVFHPVVGRLLLFGGFLLPSAGATADLRSFDPPAPTGTGSGWSLVTPEVPDGPPPARGAHCAAWDPIREELVVFGGVVAASAHLDPDNFRGDTWVLAGASPTSPGSWRRRTPAASPPPRFGAACAWDGVGVLLFGGTGLDRERFGDLWRWDGADWTRLSDGSGVGPEPRYGAMMAWDPAGGRMLVYGGFGGAGEGDSYDESWEWSVPPEGTEARWLQHTGQTPSERRFGGIATLDPGIFPGSAVPAAGGVVIFGGARSDVVFRNDVWLLQPALE